MAEYQVLYWKDIPAQVRVFHGKRRVARQMPPRFQEAIDRLAMKEGLARTRTRIGSSSVPETRTVLPALVEDLERAYDERGWNRGFTGLLPN